MGGGCRREKGVEGRREVDRRGIEGGGVEGRKGRRAEG